MKYKIIGLLGPSGSGKDTLANELYLKRSNLFHRVILTTSRPKRDYEIEDVDYHFVSKDEFIELIDNQDIITFSVFNDWYYGIDKTELSRTRINLLVSNPSQAFNLYLKNNIVDSKFFLLNTKPEERLLRQLRREENPDVKEIIRRYDADRDDFKNLENKNIITRVLNNNDEIDQLSALSNIIYCAENWDKIN